MKRSFLVAALAAVLAACAPHVELPGPRIGQPALNGKSVLTEDGYLLPLRAWIPNPHHPEAVIIALHGFNDYSNSYAESGKYWAARGIVTYAYDQRGFGRADRTGLWHGSRALAEDLRSVVEVIRRKHPGLPVYIVGESMGGAVVMTAMADPKAPEVDGIILSAPAVWGRAGMGPIERIGLWFFSHTVPWYAVKAGDWGVRRRASDNIEMLRALGRDPLVIKATRIEAIHGLVDLMDAAQQAAPKLEVPTLVLYGEKDEIIPPDSTYRTIGTLVGLGDERRVAIYPEGYHMLMRDLQAEVVLNDIAAWIKDRNAPLPSGAEANAVIVLAEHGISPQIRFVPPGPQPAQR